MSKDTFYFSHDYNTRNDIKIKRLIAKHGYLGYGIFWAIIEELYNNANALPLDYECIAYDMRTNENVIDSIINDFDLFVICDGFFGSSSVERRLEQRNEKSIKAKESANKRWEKIKEDANALRTHSDGNAIKESKGKESKGKESKGKESSFEIFWNLFEKKVDSKKTKEKFLKLSDTEIIQILNVVPEYVKSTPEVKYRKNPLTWLNGKCWNDSILQQSTETRFNCTYRNAMGTSKIIHTQLQIDEFTQSGYHKLLSQEPV